jgi:hypothetical protein
MNLNHFANILSLSEDVFEWRCQKLGSTFGFPRLRPHLVLDECVSVTSAAGTLTGGRQMLLKHLSANLDNTLSSGDRGVPNGRPIIPARAVEAATHLEGLGP